MAVDGISAKVSGIPELKAALLGIPDKLRRRALRNALAAGARVVQRAARAVTPVLQRPSPFRTAGTVRKAISVRTSKLARRAGNVGVFVNVRPAKGSQRGAKSRTDPFYWRWLNFGWYAGGRGNKRLKFAGESHRIGSRQVRGVGFLEAGARQLGQALQVFISKIGPQIQKLNGGKDVQL
jgi:hypothetical protein